MSALGQKQTCAPQTVMSALPLKADSCSAQAHVCFGPKADISPVQKKRPPCGCLSKSKQTFLIQVAAAHRFLRQPSRPNAPRPDAVDEDCQRTANRCEWDRSRAKRRAKTPWLLPRFGLLNLRVT